MSTGTHQPIALFDRKHIKLKFSAEERVRPQIITAALRNRKKPGTFLESWFDIVEPQIMESIKQMIQLRNENVQEED